MGAGEEGFVDLGIVEAGHRAGIQAQRARGQDQVGALQAAIAERAFVAAFTRAVEPGLGIGVREQVRQLLVEILVEADNDGDRCGQGLVVVAFGQCRGQLGLGLRRLHEHEARRAAVGGGRAPLHQLVQGVQLGVFHRRVEEGVLGTGSAEQLVQCSSVERVGHRWISRAAKGSQCPRATRGEKTIRSVECRACGNTPQG
nr:hypothetical protein [uncultured Deinococcus sp.]